MEEKYYVIVNAGTQFAVVLKYCYKTLFSLEDAKLHAERWEKKNDPYKAIIVEEINDRDKKIEEVLS